MKMYIYIQNIMYKAGEVAWRPVKDVMEAAALHRM